MNRASGLIASGGLLLSGLGLYSTFTTPPTMPFMIIAAFSLAILAAGCFRAGRSYLPVAVGFALGVPAHIACIFNDNLPPVLLSFWLLITLVGLISTAALVLREDRASGAARFVPILAAVACFGVPAGAASGSDTAHFAAIAFLSLTFAALSLTVASEGAPSRRLA
ncbi:hypothetical protein [Smaragdicoccus niigatensis]|uniref:hypothetical protein n=1 Tax=Smaragdicoccus niigatensis TaxID=359359 RepID=UPI00037959ED|nr:hypothetical protein [Smaragdicoccus niigatensis]